MLGRKLRLVILSTSIGFISLMFASLAFAEDWPVGVRCEVYDSVNSTHSDFSKISIGPWVMTQNELSRDGVRYSLLVDASDLYGRGVIYIRNLETDAQDTIYGPVNTHEKFRLNFEGWQIECNQWPYIAG